MFLYTRLFFKLLVSQFPMHFQYAAFLLSSYVSGLDIIFVSR